VSKADLKIKARSTLGVERGGGWTVGNVVVGDVLGSK
jgi:hypothetical protein